MSIVRLLQQWWSTPVDQLWLRSFLETRSLTRTVQLLIAALALGLTVEAVATRISAQVSDDALSAAISILFTAMAFGWALWWALRPWPSLRTSAAFLITADLGIVVVALQDRTALAKFSCVLLLTVTGLYVTFFHGPRALAAHVGWSVLGAGLGLAPLLTGPDSDPYLAVAKAVSAAMMLIAIPVVTHIGIWLIRADAKAALCDPLTGLFNRRGVLHQVQREIVAGTWGEPLHLVVLMLDLDHFKGINDSYGHAVGDDVLIQTTQRLKTVASSGTVIGRMGGDEFTVVDFMNAAAILPFAEQIRGIIAAPTQHASVTVSIGTASVAAAGIDAANVAAALESAWRRADSAMYGAKKLGGNAVNCTQE